MTQTVHRGECRCGEVQMQVTAAPVITMACHCRGCQRMSSSAFSLSAMVPAAAFAVTSGTVEKGGAHTDGLDHYCCPNCKSWLFTRIGGVDDLVNVRPTMFDDPAWSEPFMETMTAEKLAWATTPAEHSYEGFPSMEDFPRLMQAFAARS